MTVLHMAERMTLRNVSLGAYGYVVNGKSAIGWLMDRYHVRTDKDSGIVNDPNEYSDDPRYIVGLVERVVRVSMETLEIVHNLPPLNEREQPADWPKAWKVM
jgi:predicted helicase